MIDREKVITELKVYINYPEPLCSIVNNAIELLEEQETIFERDGHHIRCTHCNSYWCSTDREGNAFPTNYCPECGKAVKWDE